MYQMQRHFMTFTYRDGVNRAPFKQHVMRSCFDRKKYTLRLVHTLACLLDPRYIGEAAQPDGQEALQAFALLKELACAHVVFLALREHSVIEEDEMPPA